MHLVPVALLDREGSTLYQIPSGQIPKPPKQPRFGGSGLGPGSKSRLAEASFGATASQEKPQCCSTYRDQLSAWFVPEPLQCCSTRIGDQLSAAWRTGPAPGPPVPVSPAHLRTSSALPRLAPIRLSHLQPSSAPIASHLSASACLRPKALKLASRLLDASAANLHHAYHRLALHASPSTSLNMPCLETFTSATFLRLLRLHSETRADPLRIT